MGELIPFPQTPPEPIPPHQPEPGEEPPENVIFPDKFQQKTEEEEKGIQLLPEDGKELARKEAAEFLDIWGKVLQRTGGKPKTTTADGWDYHDQDSDWSVDISQTDPQEDNEGVITVRLREKEGAKQTLTSLKIGSSYYGDSMKLRRERVDILRQEQTGKKLGSFEPWEASVVVLYDEEGEIIGAGRYTSDEGVKIAHRLAEKVVEKIS